MYQVSLSVDCTTIGTIYSWLGFTLTNHVYSYYNKCWQNE